MNPYLLIGIRFSKLVKMVGRNKAGYMPIQLVRLAFLFLHSFWASVMTKFEKIEFGKRINATELPAEILIIIGHWRTGSTYMHNLLSHDQNFATPSLYHTAYPDSFLLSEKYIKPVMRLFVRKHRPMDKVALGVDLPQEDEYALVRMTADSPLEKLIFPDSNKYFMFSPPDHNSGEWKSVLTEFCKKLHFRYQKNILLKNPFHSLRIKELAEIFPNARFICMHRHPFSVVPSTIKLWSVVGKDNNLSGTFIPPQIDEISAFYNSMYEKIEQDFSILPEQRYCHIKFEELESDPVGTVKSIYKSLNLDFTPDFEKNMFSYLKSLGIYQKNHFELTSENKHEIVSNLHDYMQKYGYNN
jgi:hypothetical protein